MQSDVALKRSGVAPAGGIGGLRSGVRSVSYLIKALATKVKIIL